MLHFTREKCKNSVQICIETKQSVIIYILRVAEISNYPSLNHSLDIQGTIISMYDKIKNNIHFYL